MRAVLQRVTQAQVEVAGMVEGRIASGLLILLGVSKTDTPAEAEALCAKILNLRIFSDAAGKMNLSLIDTGGELLVVSQFTLYGDARGQRRPSFIQAAPAVQGKALYEQFVGAFKALGVGVQTGVFRADMSVELTNEGPVTILLDSDKTF